MFKKVISVSLLLLFFLSVSTDVEAQKRGTKKREKKERSDSSNSERSRSSRDRGESSNTVSFTDRINYEISIGNISFNQGFGITLKPHAAYKFTERLSAGIAVRTFYDFVNIVNGDDLSLFSYGPSGFGRFKITDEIYVQGEYNIMSYDQGPNGDRVSKSSPMFGLGYLSGYGPWRFGLQLLFIGNEEFRDFERSTVDYWFSFSYNF
ncbi:MAG: hypothetical protein HKO66_02520 [Saprospiraceae bacterium]|nr:hypothetical protein [Bacteroidia bacterium]NNE16429.1 hypothetical protein [Saprospiraceae bacterium]NNL91087.1 hypothetical protein [Saprospiraceae bacterium]